MGNSTRAVIFDLFETLITQFDPNWSPPAQSWSVLFGISPSEYARHWKEIGQSWERGELGSCQEALDRLYTATSVSIGDDHRSEFEANMRRSVHRAYETIEPHIKEMLRDLKEAVFCWAWLRMHTRSTQKNGPDVSWSLISTTWSCRTVLACVNPMPRFSNCPVPD